MHTMFAEDLKRLLLSGKVKEAEDFILNGNKDHIQNNSLHLIPTVSEVLNENLGNEDVLSCCETILLHIAETGVPKETLVAILEQISIVDSEIIFQIFLKPLGLVLLKLPSQRGKTLKWALDTIQVYIAKLPVPETCNYQGEERLFLDLDPSVQQSTEVVGHYLLFLKPFVDEVCLLSPAKTVVFAERTSYQRDILSYHMLQILDHPMPYLDLSHEDGKAESASRACATKIMTYLRCLKGNSLDLYEFAHDYSNYRHDPDLGDAEVSTLAVSTLAYLIVKERLGNLPSILAPTYIFETHLKFCTVLLSNTSDLVQFKGLHLLESVISYVDSSSLTKKVLDHQYLSKLQQCLITIMVYSSMDEYRQHALQLFKSFLEKFDSDAKSHVLVDLLHLEKHAGVRGLLINLYKDCCHRAMASSEENPFLGNNFRMFLKFATELPEEVETDLLEESDAIFGTLNFLRYLVIRDPRDRNVTGIWDMVDEIKSNYLEPLRTGLNISRAHYKQKAAEEWNKKKSKLPKTVLQAGSQKLPNLPENSELQVLQSALLTFELLESVMVRLEESL